MNQRCFVIMPSGNHGEYERGVEEADFIFNDIFSRGVREALGNDTLVEREQDKRQSGAIAENIVKRIAQYEVAIVDITGHNPNVFLELGMRYALRRSTTITVKQSGTEMPFDIANFRCIDYKPFIPEAAREDIKRALDERQSFVGPTDSLVFNAYPDLQITLPDPTDRLSKHSVLNYAA